MDIHSTLFETLKMKKQIILSFLLALLIPTLIMAQTKPNQDKEAKETTSTEVPSTIEAGKTKPESNENKPIEKKQEGQEENQEEVIIDIVDYPSN